MACPGLISQPGTPFTQAQEAFRPRVPHAGQAWEGQRFGGRSTSGRVISGQHEEMRVLSRDETRRKRTDQNPEARPLTFRHVFEELPFARMAELVLLPIDRFGGFSGSLTSEALRFEGSNGDRHAVIGATEKTQRETSQIP